MRSAIWLLVGVLALGCSFAAGLRVLTPVSQPEPTLRADPPVLDFGEVGQRETLTATVNLINSFDQAVQIVDLGRRCSCSETELSAKSVEPGQQVVMSVRWRIGTRRGTAHEELEVLYRTATGDMATAPVRLVATVLPDVALQPEDLPAFEAGRPSSSTIKVLPGRAGAVNVKGAATNHSAFTAKADAVRNEVTVTFDPSVSGADGPNIVLTVLTDNPVASELQIPIQVKPPSPSTRP